MPVLVREVENVEWIIEWKVQVVNYGEVKETLLLDRFPDSLPYFTFICHRGLICVVPDRKEAYCELTLRLVRSEKPAVPGTEALCSDRAAAGVVPDTYYRPLSITVSWDGRSGEVMEREETPRMEKWTYTVSKYPCARGNQPLSLSLVFSIKFKTFDVSEMVEALKHTTDYLFLQQSHCDVQFCFPNDEEPISGHKKILSSRSSVFAAMFQHKMQESKTGKFFIQDTERDTFYQLLHYIYSGRTWTSLNEGTAQKLLLAAVKYNVTGLSIECTSYLILNITWQRAVDLMIWAQVHSIDKVKEAALDVVAKNGKRICPLKSWEELMSNYPRLCLEATRRMTA